MDDAFGSLLPHVAAVLHGYTSTGMKRLAIASIETMSLREYLITIQHDCVHWSRATVPVS